MKRHILVIISILVLGGLLLAACGSPAASATAASATATNAPAGGSATDGQTLMQQRCSVCHSLDRITSAHKTADQWKTTVERMISHGAQLSPQEEQILIDYLAQNYK